jgi:hypothetical protein
LGIVAGLSCCCRGTDAAAAAAVDDAIDDDVLVVLESYVADSLSSLRGAVCSIIKRDMEIVQVKTDPSKNPNAKVHRRAAETAPPFRLLSGTTMLYAVCL